MQRATPAGLLLLVPVLVVATACENPVGVPTEPRLNGTLSAAIVSSVDLKMDVTGTFWNGCVPDAEYVDIAGGIHFRVQFWQDPAKGIYRTRVHENAQGISGIGQQSGTRYQMMQTHNSVDIASPGPEFDASRHLRLQMTSHGSADNPEFHSIYTIHYDPVNGTVMTSKRLSIECNG